MNNLEQELTIVLHKYKNNNSLEIKNELKEQIQNIDKEYIKIYLENLKKLTIKETSLSKEQKRLENIITEMQTIIKRRENINNIIKDNSLELQLGEIPNIEKINIFSNKLKIIEIILNITSKVNESNKNKAIEILNRKEYKQILLELSIIKNDTIEELEKYINSKITKTINPIIENSKLKILGYYHENKKIFPNLNIPNMGLIEEKKDIEIDNKSFFIN